MADLATEVSLLKQEQRYVLDAIREMGSKVGQLADSMLLLVRYVEKHDALERRVEKVEEYCAERKKETDPIISRANWYMGGIAVVCVAGVGYLGWISETVTDLDRRVAVVEVKK